MQSTPKHVFESTNKRLISGSPISDVLISPSPPPKRKALGSRFVGLKKTQTRDKSINMKIPESEEPNVSINFNDFISEIFATGRPEADVPDGFTHPMSLTNSDSEDLFTVPETQRVRQEQANFGDDSVFDQVVLTRSHDALWGLSNFFNDSKDFPTLTQRREIVDDGFFGLPLKVKDLIKDHKGIEKLYGKFSCL